jgi:hypothetical protein
MGRRPDSVRHQQPAYEEARPRKAKPDTPCQDLPAKAAPAPAILSAAARAAAEQQTGNTPRAQQHFLGTSLPLAFFPHCAGSSHRPADSSHRPAHAAATSRMPVDPCWPMDAMRDCQKVQSLHTLVKPLNVVPHRQRRIGPMGRCSRATIRFRFCSQAIAVRAASRLARLRSPVKSSKAAAKAAVPCAPMLLQLRCRLRSPVRPGRAAARVVAPSAVPMTWQQTADL